MVILSAWDLEEDNSSKLKNETLKYVDMGKVDEEEETKWEVRHRWGKIDNTIVLNRSSYWIW